VDAVDGEGESDDPLLGVPEGVSDCVDVTLGVRELLPDTLAALVMEGVTDWLAPVEKEEVGELEMLGVLEGVGEGVGVRVTAAASTVQASVAPEPEPM